MSGLRYVYLKTADGFVKRFVGEEFELWKVGANLGEEERERDESNGRENWEGAMKLNGERGTLYYLSYTLIERESDLIYMLQIYICVVFWSYMVKPI